MLSKMHHESKILKSQWAEFADPFDASKLVGPRARAWHGQRLVDGGAYTSSTDVSGAKGIEKSYVSRILRLALLAPAIV